jgi:hypothetical protein
MELKKEDFILMRNFQDQEFLALKLDAFDNETVEEMVEESGELPPDPVPELEPEPPSEEELAKLAKEKEIAELKAKLEALEK